MNWPIRISLGMLVLSACLGIAGCEQEPVLHPDGYGPSNGNGTTCGAPYWGSQQVPFDHVVEWTPDGTQIIFNHAPLGEPFLGGHSRTAIWIADSDGTRLSMVVDTNPGHYYLGGFYFDLSPDGSQIAFATCHSRLGSRSTAFRAGNALMSTLVPTADAYEIAVVDLDSGVPRLLTQNRILDHFPVWSPDGTRIAFISEDEDGSGMLFTMAPDGSNVQAIKTGLSTNLVLAPPVWSPDGERLAFLVDEGQQRPFRRIVYTVKVDGSELARIARTANVVKFSQSRWEYIAPAVPSWSPDSQYLAFVMADEYGVTIGVQTARFDGTELRQVFDGRAYKTSWSPDGSAILLVGDDLIYIVQPDGSILHTFGEAQLLSRVPSRTIAWSPDGTRIAIYDPGSPRIGVPGETYTLARDGTDPHGVVWRNSEPWIPLPNQTAPDVVKCSSGVVVQEPEANPELVADCKTLLSIRDALAGRADLNWNSETRIAEWEGITVEGNPPRVTWLQLGNRGLTGVLPREIGNLSALRVLDFGTYSQPKMLNRLHGSIPNELERLGKLNYLSLRYNHLSGEIPTGLGNLKGLNDLDLNGNYLSGEIPSELSSLTGIQSLRLGGNALSGPIPPELGSLTRLRVLDLSYNDLSGLIPAELGALTDLERLYIDRVLLTSDVPGELKALAAQGKLSIGYSCMPPQRLHNIGVSTGSNALFSNRGVV